MLASTAHLLQGKIASDQRLHLHHGPIDLIIGIDADEKRQKLGFQWANNRFQTILTELVAELALLKSPAKPEMGNPKGPTAKRMVDAVRPLSRHRFITPMAAVAGSVADEILEAIKSGFSEHDLPERIYVNNGGDIAIHLAGSEVFTAKISAENQGELGYMRVDAASPSRGIATSGRGGRSLTMGIADSVTTFARNAAEADALATMIANAVDLPGHPAITRKRACDLVDDSDLADRLVVPDCGLFSETDVQTALKNGLREAYRMQSILPFEKAALFLRNHCQIFIAEHPEFSYSSNPKSLELARYA